MKSNDPTAPPGAVTVYSRRQASGALLLRHAQLDANGQTLTVVGPKSLLPGRMCGERVIVRLPNGGLVVGRITHFHTAHDAYRIAISTADVARVGGQVPLTAKASTPLDPSRPARDLIWVSQTVPPARRS